MGDVVNFDRDPPADLGADVRGLPPARARLARFVAWRRRETDALAMLEAGRGKLMVRIEKAEEAGHRESAAVNAAAASVVEQIKRGLDWTLGAVRKRPTEPEADLTVERTALAKLDAAIAAKRAEVDAIGKRLADASDAALVEHAEATIGAEYHAAIEAVRAAMTRLEGLEVAIGRGREGRLVGELPGFATAGHELGVTAVAAPQREVAAAGENWRELARVWSDDPRADASKVLLFSKHDPGALKDVVYHQLTDVERRLVDARRATA